MGLARGQQFPAPITAGCSPRPWAATFLGGTPRAAQGGGCLHQGGHGQGCGCLQPGWNYSWHSISLSTGLYPLPAVGMWGPDFLPFCQAISWCPTSAHWCWHTEAHSELCHVCPTLRATLAHPGAPYQHLAHPKAGKGVTHKEVTPGARSPKLGSAGFCWVQIQLPTTPSWMGRQPLPMLYPWECHQRAQAPHTLGLCIN